MEKFSEKKRRLNYTIHNPNTVDNTAKMLLDILIEANGKKVERAIQNRVMFEQNGLRDSKEYLT